MRRVLGLAMLTPAGLLVIMTGALFVCSAFNCISTI